MATSTKLAVDTDFCEDSIPKISSYPSLDISTAIDLIRDHYGSGRYNQAITLERSIALDPQIEFRGLQKLIEEISHSREPHLLYQVELLSCRLNVLFRNAVRNPVKMVELCEQAEDCPLTLNILLCHLRRTNLSVEQLEDLATNPNILPRISRVAQEILHNQSNN